MLNTIITEIAHVEGQDLSIAGERNLLLTRINRAARELYIEYDIEESLQEKVFDFNVNTQQVTLPFYIAHIRGMRLEALEQKVEADAQRNRYNYGLDNRPWPLKWRKAGFSILQREIQNESIIIASVPVAESKDVTISLIGTTENADRVKDTLILPAGETSVEGSVSFKDPMYGISKDITTDCNITLKDVEDNILAIIPNWSPYINYRSYQVSDVENSGDLINNEAVEIYFKHMFIDAIDDSDLFWGTEKYDDVIIYKYFKLYSESLQVSAAISAQAILIMNSLVRDERFGTRNKVSVKRPGLFDLPYARRN
jgi:hypothetical protein